MKYVLFPNLSKKAAFAATSAAAARLIRLGAEVCISETDAPQFADIAGIQGLPDQTLLYNADFAIAVGGDGTILQCAGKLLQDAAQKRKPPVKLVGINTGTLGFLAAFEANELEMLDRIQNGQYAISERMMLQTTIRDGEHDGTVSHALNDIFASRLNGKICDFTVSVDDKQIGVYRADGIIFSTPTGSTAYALSAGGPVIEPDLSLIEMNLICPHSLFARPMLFSPQRSIRVTYRGAGDGGLTVHIDGAQSAVLHNAQSFSVTQSAYAMPFVNCKGHAFYDALRGKLMQPLKGLDE